MAADVKRGEEFAADERKDAGGRMDERGWKDEGPMVSERIVERVHSGKGERSAKWTPGKRAAVFVGITFGLTWAIEFGVIWPLATGSAGPISGYGMGGMSMLVYALISLMMFMPMVGMLLTRLITREGMRDAWFKPVKFRRTWKWWIVAWLGTIALAAVGAVVYFLLFPGDFDSSMSAMVATTMETVQAQGLSLPEDQVRMALYSQLITMLFVPFINIVPAFGEEWGWRGYLMPKLLGRFRVVPALLIMGVIWGLWHMPLTMLGHNYGVGYAGYPFLGIAAMCWMCCSMGVFLAFLTLKTGTCIPAALAHGFFNGCAAAGTLFSATGGNALVGPGAMGVLGVVGFTVVAVAMLVALHRRERAGLPLSVREECDAGDESGGKAARDNGLPQRPDSPSGA
ncbi:CPBP family intramembrane glutamic endopeptidase [uncultured Slackia sp.]|uniref:CPBP family intramembrane glutamic endopeptidase n=1 Tax=uncultured Slackia sp. TaxID=665903 RepID=UPI0025D8AB5B|nr:type II CAAX endopeptidase family protein [uncultured Slackia sp.]